MKRLAYNFYLACSLAVMAAFALTSARASESTPSTCTIHSGTCVGANNSTRAITNAQRSALTSPIWSARAGQGTATYAIDLGNKCRWLDTAATNASGTELFVPFRTDNEWNAFVTAVETPNSQPAQIVHTVHCSRPGDPAGNPNQGKLHIPANDPDTANPSDAGHICYDESGARLGITAYYIVTAYGRTGDKRVVTPAAASFKCYTAQGDGPWTKKVTSMTISGLDADENDAAFSGSNYVPGQSDWAINKVNYSVTEDTKTAGKSIWILDALGGYTQDECYTDADPRLYYHPFDFRFTVSEPKVLQINGGYEWENGGYIITAKFWIVDQSGKTVYNSPDPSCGQYSIPLLGGQTYTLRTHGEGCNGSTADRYITEAAISFVN